MAPVTALSEWQYPNGNIRIDNRGGNGITGHAAICLCLNNLLIFRFDWIGPGPGVQFQLLFSATTEINFLDISDAPGICTENEMQDTVVAMTTYIYQYSILPIRMLSASAVKRIRYNTIGFSMILVGLSIHFANLKHILRNNPPSPHPPFVLSTTFLQMVQYSV